MSRLSEEVTPEVVLDRAAVMLATAKRGLADVMSTDPSRRQPGIYNLIVFGRAVTFVLQNLRTVDREYFDVWYLPRQTAMTEDPLLRYFSVLRTQLEKEGNAGTSTTMFLRSLNTADLASTMADPPPGAKGFFIGDSSGGSGWEVQMADGSVEKFYVALPPHVESNIETELHFSGAPLVHQGQEISDTSIPTLGRLYVDYLDALLRDARREFLPQPV